MAYLTVIFSIALNILLVQGNQDGTADISFDITCHESMMEANFTVTGTDANLKFASSRNLYLELLDTSCHSNDSARSTFSVQNDHNNQSFIGTYNVSIGIKFLYNECSTMIVNETDKIVAKNTAILKVTDGLRQGRTKRDYYYEFKMYCEIPRNADTATNRGYVVDYSVTNITRSANRTGVFNLPVHMAFYTDDTYGTMHPSGALMVNTNEFIYVKIAENNSNTDFKFVVNQCSASKYSSPNPAEDDIFFDNKCSLDTTLVVPAERPHSFEFKIQTFNYLMESSAVYFHCKIYICRATDTDEPCTQTCAASGNRYRRDVDEVDIKYEEVTLTSGQIIFNNKATCQNMNCISNSKCYELEPAQCYCDKGYVYSYEYHECISDRQFKVGKIRLLQPWNPVYSDVNSIEFKKLDLKYSSLLLRAVKATDMNNDIDNIKIVGATEGSIVLEAVILYSKRTTAKTAFEKFVKGITEDNLRSRFARKDLAVSNDVTPTFIADVKESINDIQKIILVITIVVLLLVIFVAGILIFKVRKSRRGSAKDVTSFDNKGVAINNLS